MALGFELSPQQIEIVDLAVEDQRDTRTLMHHGLDAGRQIDDRQPPMREPDHGGSIAGAVQKEAFAIRPPMPDAVAHRLQPPLGIRYSTLKNEAGYAAHVIAVTSSLASHLEFGETLEEPHRR